MRTISPRKRLSCFMSNLLLIIRKTTALFSGSFCTQVLTSEIDRLVLLGRQFEWSYAANCSLHSNDTDCRLKCSYHIKNSDYSRSNVASTQNTNDYSRLDVALYVTVILSEYFPHISNVFKFDFTLLGIIYII